MPHEPPRPVDGPERSVPEEQSPWDQATFFADEDFICRGTERNRACLKLRQGILWVIVENEPRGEDLIACFRRGLDIGIVELSMPTLVDLTGFTGAVDWASIRAVRDLAPWAATTPERSRIAYMVRNRQFGVLIHIASILFARSCHRMFLCQHDALRWLRS